ncbi:glycosyltransferase family 2 protein [Agarivorans sp. TSD2052]|uniref:glycosyltransferase family 2 protein n=1 Tax=Agarivorans sp. TSD2052 TaxID=2937286 RepID=UPI00200BE3F3|nr:glycosyltransferase family 2 protein [Agarivorans sp. TSD2052]UPW20046.1 glycosyltransferase family 2 protein [Agarivorans sp. TSD2052]
MLPAYSVAMCTFNGALFLQQQLESIAKQSHPPHELVVCDDGSSDNSLALVRLFAKNHPSIKLKLVENPVNLGFIKNFEQALSLCTQEYILLSDQDDYWLSNRAEVQLTYLVSHPNKQMVFSDAYRTDEALNIIQPDLWQCVHFSSLNQQRFNQQQALSVLLRHNVVTGATVALTKQFVKQQLPLNSEYPHDAWLALKAAQNDAIGLIPERLIKYRQHQQNALGAQYQSTATKIKKALKGYWRNQFPPEFFMRLKAYQALLDSAHCSNEQRALILQVRSFQEFRLSIIQGKQARLAGFKCLAHYWRANYYHYYAAASSSLLKDILRLSFSKTKYAGQGQQ